MPTLFDKLWDAHRVAIFPGGADLLSVDRHLVHELTGAAAIEQLEHRGLALRSPAQTFATVDHVISTRPGRRSGNNPWSVAMVEMLREQTSRLQVRRFDLDDGDQGILHVIGPELGLTLPGLSIVCGDSHACTHGAFGALAWGIGSSEVVHVLATQTIRQKRPRQLRLRFDGVLPPGATAKDMALHALGRVGATVGVGHAIEFAGAGVRALDMEGRMTLCNLAIEMGAKIGLIAPDERTYAYLRGRRHAPQGAAFDAAVQAWRLLPSDADAVFDHEIALDATTMRPIVSWGTSPDQVAAVDGVVPDPAAESDHARRVAMRASIDYMRLLPGQRIDAIVVDRVFIGSCANGRLSDLRAAAAVLRGRHISAGVQGWVVPGSLAVRREAEAEGLHHVFLDAGFEWREPGCSMCVGANGDIVAPGERCISTSNRNFVGRQGPGALTHLASPAVAAASALAGRIAAPAAGAAP